MGYERQAAVRRLLTGGSGSLLDVGTGRGEALAIATECGFAPVVGTDVVVELLQADRVLYAEAHSLPFAPESFDVVTCFDVLEHLLHEDQVPALREMCRVASRAVIVTAADYSSLYDGVELHVGRRHYDDWHRLIVENCAGHVSRVGWCGTSEGWRVDL